MCLFQDICRTCEVFFGAISGFSTSESDGGTNPTVLRLLCVSGATCDGAGRRWVVCDVILFIQTP